MTSRDRKLFLPLWLVNGSWPGCRLVVFQVHVTEPVMKDRVPFQNTLCFLDKLSELSAVGEVREHLP